MPITLLPATAPSAALVESRLDRLLKLLPTEVLLVIPAALALGGSPLWHLAVTIAGLVAVVASLRYDAWSSGLPGDWRQHAFRCGAFVAWAMVLGNPLGAWLDGAQVRQIAAFLTLGIPLSGYLLLTLEPSG